tara:strand:+ start:2863 stop:3087 length:225 start_codon:yes stop_codon:yes gene_type:complete
LIITGELIFFFGVFVPVTTMSCRLTIESNWIKLGFVEALDIIVVDKQNKKISNLIFIMIIAKVGIFLKDIQNNY